MTPEQKRLKKETEEQIEALWAYVEAVLKETEEQIEALWAYVEAVLDEREKQQQKPS